MIFQLLAFSYLIALTSSLHAPEVHEEVNEPPQNLRLFKPIHQRSINFQSLQPDQLKKRYIQQQQADELNVPKYFNIRIRRERILENPKNATWNNPTAILKTEEPKPLRPKIRKRKPPVYELNGDLATSSSELQTVINNDFLSDYSSHPYSLYLNPGSHGDEIEALSSLLGKNPNVQLAGLQQLLGNQVVKDHTPIRENVQDVANPQSKPNIKVEYGGAPQNFRVSSVSDVAKLQAQLNAQAQAQAQQIIAQAQAEAAEQIKAQHQAIAATRTQLQQAAIAKALSRPAQHSIPQSHIVATAPVQSLLKAEIVSAQPLIQTQVPIQEESFGQGLYKQQEESEKTYGTHDNLQYASRYAFGYRIRDFHSGNNYGHEETREGKTAKGHYHVLLPDGRVQNVDYYADPSGYHAKVTYANVAHH